ncbi:MAG: HDOD domain-containing protein [Burkholderiales bacterium]
MDSLHADVERKLMSAVERMPAFPRAVQKILELTRQLNCPPKDIVGVIDKDPVLTVKILKVINSAYYGLPTKITSVNQSVVFLGINTVKNLALGFAAAGTLPRNNAAGFDMHKYLLHSLTTSALARQLCVLFPAAEVDPGDCYIAGLLHDFGKVVFAQFMAEEYKAALKLRAGSGKPLHECESEVIGADHAIVGAMLAAKWQFPAALGECIRDHHRLHVPRTPLLDCLRVANQICRRQKVGDSGNPFHDDEIPATKRFGGDFEEITAALGDIEKIAADAAIFAQVGTK